MDVKKLFTCFLVLIIILTTLIGCSTSKPVLTAIDLVPQGVNLLANVQINKIINDSDLRDAYDNAPKEPEQPQTLDEALNELVTQTGINLRDFTQAVIFADITTLEQAGYLGIVAEGTFNEEQFIDSVEKQMGEEFITSDYEGYTLYMDGNDEFGISFISDEMLILGTNKAVKDAIDVSKGVRSQIADVIFDTYNQLGDALIKFAFELPEEARSALTEEPIPEEIPISLESLTDMDVLGFSLNKEADTITIQIKLHFLSIDSIVEATDMLSGAMSFFSGMIQIPEVEELLSRIDITITGSWVTIALDITISEIESLIDVFQT